MYAQVRGERGLNIGARKYRGRGSSVVLGMKAGCIITASLGARVRFSMSVGYTKESRPSSDMSLYAFDKPLQAHKRGVVESAT